MNSIKFKKNSVILENKPLTFLRGVGERLLLRDGERGVLLEHLRERRHDERKRILARPRKIAKERHRAHSGVFIVFKDIIRLPHIPEKYF